MLLESVHVAFREDAVFLEAQPQQTRMNAKPGFKMLDLALDAGPGKMLWLLDKLLKEAAAAEQQQAAAAQ